ncbi:MAG: hypothetical protein FD148_790 [Methylocystaceae bacterium]|jgi:hypothetical protein|nr:MAG: hypothetical protein FD148_790 [Methylocystaceae bacterium]
MTPAAALITAAEALEAQAAELRRKATAFGGDDRNSAQADRLVELGVAVAITRLSSATLYRIARRFDLDFQLPTGAWRFYEARLRAYVAPRE